MRLLAPSEAQELTEHFVSRPDLWIQATSSTFVRRDGADMGMALVLREAGELCALSVKPVTWSASATEKYVEWLLEKYTAYSNRMEILGLLQHSVRYGVDAVRLSVKLAELKGSHFTVRYPRMVRSYEDDLEPEETTA